MPNDALLQQAGLPESAGGESPPAWAVAAAIRRPEDHQPVVPSADVRRACFCLLSAPLLPARTAHGKCAPATRLRLARLARRCHYGVAATTRENLLAHPVEVYSGIELALNSSSMDEATFYMEWVRARARCCCPRPTEMYSRAHAHESVRACELDKSAPALHCRPW